MQGLLALVLLLATMLCRLWSSASEIAFAAMGSDAAPSLEAVLRVAASRAVRSGRAGFLAGVCQVIAFMWLRTTMNYQYKHGGSFAQTLKQLWAEGGVQRLYRGLFPFALLQAPLARFGDTAANEGVLALSAAYLPGAPLGLVTIIASVLGTCWRVVITPIDTCKTVLQTDGAKGWALLRRKVAAKGIWVLWYGWEGNYVAGILGNYPWFATVNLLSSTLPETEGQWVVLQRNALIGAAASCISDLVSNFVRVIKTQKQTSEDPNYGYGLAARHVIAQDGVKGLFLRGLETRLLANILQGVFFTVLWRGLLA